VDRNAIGAITVFISLQCPAFRIRDDNRSVPAAALQSVLDGARDRTLLQGDDAADPRYRRAGVP